MCRMVFDQQAQGYDSTISHESIQQGILSFYNAKLTQSGVMMIQIQAAAEKRKRKRRARRPLYSISLYFLNAISSYLQVSSFKMAKLRTDGGPAVALNQLGGNKKNGKEVFPSLYTKREKRANFCCFRPSMLRPAHYYSLFSTIYSRQQ